MALKAHSRCEEGASGEVATKPGYQLGSPTDLSRALTRVGPYRKCTPSVEVLEGAMNGDRYDRQGDFGAQ